MQRSKRYIFLTLEFCAGGDLSQLLRRVGPLNEQTCRRLVRNVAAALRHLHGSSLVHRDIKPQNLLLTGPLTDPATVLKLADFGFARSLPPESLASTLCGSPHYMSPELLAFKPYDAKTDLWSVGVVLAELLTGRPPFTGANPLDLFRVISSNKWLHGNVSAAAFDDTCGGILPPEIAARTSASCKEVLRGLLRIDPALRWTHEDFFSAAWLTQDSEVPMVPAAIDDGSGHTLRDVTGAISSAAALSAKPLHRISTTAAALEMKSVSVNATGAVLQQGNHVTQTGEVAKSEKAFEETASRSALVLDPAIATVGGSTDVARMEPASQRGGWFSHLAQTAANIQSFVRRRTIGEQTTHASTADSIAIGCPASPDPAPTSATHPPAPVKGDFLLDVCNAVWSPEFVLRLSSQALQTACHVDLRGLPSNVAQMDAFLRDRAWFVGAPGSKNRDLSVRRGCADLTWAVWASPAGEGYVASSQNQIGPPRSLDSLGASSDYEGSLKQDARAQQPLLNEAPFAPQSDSRTTIQSMKMRVVPSSQSREEEADPWVIVD